MGKRQSRICVPSEKYKEPDYDKIKKKKIELLAHKSDLTVRFEYEMKNLRDTYNQDIAHVESEFRKSEAVEKKYDFHNLICEAQQNLNTKALTEGCILIELDTRINHSIETKVYNDNINAANKFDYLMKGWYFFNFNKAVFDDRSDPAVVRYYDMMKIGIENLDIFPPDSCKKIIKAINDKYKGNPPDNIKDSWLYQYISSYTSIDR